MPEPTATRNVIIVNPNGLHLSPAAKFVQVAKRYQASVTVTYAAEQVDGRSVLDLLTLGATQGTELRIEARGVDAESAINALAALVAEGFGTEFDADADPSGAAASSDEPFASGEAAHDWD